HLLADRSLARDRQDCRCAGAVRGNAVPQNRGRPPVRGYRPPHGRAVGQLSADLFAGRPDQLRLPAPQTLALRSMSSPTTISTLGSAPSGDGTANQGGPTAASTAAMRQS